MHSFQLMSLLVVNLNDTDEQQKSVSPQEYAGKQIGFLF